MKLIEAFNYSIGDAGIFSALSSFNVPWSTDALILDADYLGNHSGEKETSPLIDKMSSSGALSSAQINTLATIIYSKYGLNWQKLYDTLSLEYNPIENYRMTETGEDEKKHLNNEELSGTDKIDVSGTNTGTVKNEGSRKNTGTVGVESSQTSEAEIAGFNSADYVDDNQTIGTGASTRTDNLAETSEDTRTDALEHSEEHTTTYGRKSEESGEDTLKHTLTRSGNIGVTTSQQMIESERALWFWNFIEYVYTDIDKVLTTPIYGATSIYSAYNPGGGSGGGGDNTEVLSRLKEIESQINTATSNIRSDITDVILNDNSNTSTIRSEISSLGTNIRNSITQATSEIASNDNANTADIRADIIDVETSEY